VTAEFGKQPEIGHHQSKTPVTIARNMRSRQTDMTAHGDPKYANDEPAIDTLGLMSKQLCHAACPQGSQSVQLKAAALEMIQQTLITFASVRTMLVTPR